MQRHRCTSAQFKGMIQLTSLLFLITAMQACVPGTGKDTAKMTIPFEVPYTESNKKHYENFVKKTLNKIASVFPGLKRNSDDVRVTSRSAGGKLVVDVQAVNVGCEFKHIFAEEFKQYMGDQRFNITCPAQ
ncbi:hypothetical protein Y032_0005g2702 [Ancylostoma ceylanicum]|uniref:Uncharacterized protein n=1 Tax=Ancylostoma ceylanicum TaxID=53326 RepID=A0A016VTD3_9BILA|nr:hypothetical protein Y032_0005g2702 [Ancylostoma ceylanicum]